MLFLFQSYLPPTGNVSLPSKKKQFLEQLDDEQSFNAHTETEVSKNFGLKVWHIRGRFGDGAVAFVVSTSSEIL